MQAIKQTVEPPSSVSLIYCALSIQIESINVKLQPKNCGTDTMVCVKAYQNLYVLKSVFSDAYKGTQPSQDEETFGIEVCNCITKNIHSLVQTFATKLTLRIVEVLLRGPALRHQRHSATFAKSDIW